VASSLPGVRAVFNESSVLYFRPGDEKDLANRILELYRNPEKRDALIVSAKAQYNELRWPIMRDRYLGVYKRLLD
jgi:glycosyltransferase involved in cell wall biosynthesis